MPLKCPKIIYERNDRGFPKFDNNPKHLHDITNNELWRLKKFFWTINNKTMLQEKLCYVFILSTENNITKSLSYEEAIKE